MIRVASYNMRKAIGTDRRRRPERTIEVLNELDADVIALQEADRARIAGERAPPPDRGPATTRRYSSRARRQHGWHGKCAPREEKVGVVAVSSSTAVVGRGRRHSALRRTAALRVVGALVCPACGAAPGECDPRPNRRAPGRAADGPDGELNELERPRGCTARFGPRTSSPMRPPLHARRQRAQLDGYGLAGLSS